MSLRRDLQQAVETTLREHGVERWTFGQGQTHCKYRFTFAGQEIAYTISSSPSDRRCLERAKSELRKVLGVKRVVHKNPANRAKAYRKAAKPKAIAPTVTPGRDFWGALKGVVAVPHFGALGCGVIGIDAAARGLADAILGEGLFA